MQILTARSGIDARALFGNICEDLSYIMRSQKHNTLLFSRWLPELNLEPCSMQGFQLDRQEALLVLEKRQEVFGIITEALRTWALPRGHLAHTMNGTLVQWKRLGTASESRGAAAGDLLWSVMCDECTTRLQNHVAQRPLEKVEMLRPNTKYVRMLGIKQLGNLDVYSYVPEPNGRDGCACDAEACANCQRVSGVISSYKIAQRREHKQLHAAVMGSLRPADPGGHADSFNHAFRRQCSDSFDHETASDAAGEKENTDDGDCEHENLPTSDDNEDGVDCDLQEGHELTMDDSSGEGQLEWGELFDSQHFVDHDFFQLLFDERDTPLHSQTREEDAGPYAMHTGPCPRACLRHDRRALGQMAVRAYWGLWLLPLPKMARLLAKRGPTTVRC